MGVIQKVSRHKPPVLVFVVFILAAVSSTLAFRGKNGVGGLNGNANAEYAIGLWGDVPYSDAQALVGVPNMIADMNSQKLAFTVNDGDLKQGSGNCDDALYNRCCVWVKSRTTLASRSRVSKIDDGPMGA
jgi:hypothetical protein